MDEQLEEETPHEACLELSDALTSRWKVGVGHDFLVGDAADRAAPHDGGVADQGVSFSLQYTW